MTAGSVVPMSAMAADTNHVPTAAKTVNTKVVTATAHRAAAPLPEMLGANTPAGFGMINGSAPTSANYAGNLALEVWGSNLNTNPDPYWWNYYYNFAADADHQSADALLNPAVSGSPIKADTTVSATYGGVSVSLYKRPDILIGVDWRYHDPSYDSANIVDYPSSLNIVNGKGSGIAIANMTDDDTAFYEFWKNAGVLDVAITEANNGYNMDNDARLAGYKKEALFPYEGWLGGIILSDSKYFTVTNLELSVGSHNYRPDRNWDNFLKGLSASRGVSLDIVRSDLNKKSANLGGSAVYPAIVVADKTIKDKINSSPLWKAGFLDNTVVEDFAVDIGGDYSIYVNPVGFENWADGGLEAPLESYWIQWRIMGTMNQSQVRRTVGDFYEKFFGLTMSDADLDSIITG